MVLQTTLALYLVGAVLGAQVSLQIINKKLPSLGRARTELQVAQAGFHDSRTHLGSQQHCNVLLLLGRHLARQVKEGETGPRACDIPWSRKSKNRYFKHLPFLSHLFCVLFRAASNWLTSRSCICTEVCLAGLLACHELRYGRASCVLCQC
jgi:hypothetical protein